MGQLRGAATPAEHGGEHLIGAAQDCGPVDSLDAFRIFGAFTADTAVSAAAGLAHPLASRLVSLNLDKARSVGPRAVL